VGYNVKCCHVSYCWITKEECFGFLRRNAATLSMQFNLIIFCNIVNVLLKDEKDTNYASKKKKKKKCW
jgi:hypothetical protein